MSRTVKVLPRLLLALSMASALTSLVGCAPKAAPEPAAAKPEPLRAEPPEPIEEPEPPEPSEQPEAAEAPPTPEGLDSPQIRDAGRYLEELTTAGLGEGALLCRVTIARDRDWDARGLFGRNVAPDPTVYLRVAGSSEARAWLPEDTYEGVVSVPAVRLAPGDAVRLRVVDRDIVKDDPVGALSLIWAEGPPLVASEGPLTVRCALLPLTRTRPLGEEALERARRELARAERDPLRVELRSAESPPLGGARASLRASLHEAASFLGQREPALAPLLAREATLLARAARAWSEAFEREYARAPRGESETRLDAETRVTLGGLECKKEPLTWRCTLALTASYGAVPAIPGFIAPVTARLLFEDREGPTSCSLSGFEAFVREPGPKAHTFECIVWDEEPIPARALVRLNGPRGVGLFALDL